MSQWREILGVENDFVESPAKELKRQYLDECSEVGLMVKGDLWRTESDKEKGSQGRKASDTGIGDF